MKKSFALILALALMASLSVTVFAAGDGSALDIDAMGNQTITVLGKYVLPAAGTTYSVDIEWSGMEFTYTAVAKWDPAQQKNVEDTTKPGAWSTNKGTITVTNKSNAPINAALSFVGVGEDSAKVTGSFGKNTLTMAAASAGAPTTDTTTFEITGGKIAANGNIGTITVALSDPGVTP